MKIGTKNRLNRQTRILFATHTRPDYMPPPAYSDNMVICSPFYPDSQDKQGNIRSICLPEKQHYDLAALINSLPPAQQPDLVIIRLDSTFQHIPGNVHAISQPTIGMIGDTHHMRRPLQTMLDYLLRERFDHLLIDHTPQHTHWFSEAGLSPIVWLPGTLLADQWITPCKKPDPHVIFIGQMGKAHPVRNRMLEGLLEANIPLKVQSAPQTIACQHYNQAAITFNHSLNGDFNLRVFETLASGGFLLTEQLEPQAGQNTIFKDGEHLVCYSGHKDLIAKSRYYLEHTSERNRIAKAGHAKVKEIFSIQHRLLNFDQLLAGQMQAHWQPINFDGRTQAYGCKNKPDLIQRMAIYEWVQEQHRLFNLIQCNISPHVDPRIVCDLTDLPRLILSIKNNPTVLTLAAQADIRKDRFENKANDSDPVIMQLLASEDIETSGVATDTTAVIISDWLDLDAYMQEKISTTCDKANLTAANHTQGLFHNNLEWSDVWNKPPHT